mmetsp:Transcript_49622/g.105617  ORF Transcript_49622/g.105617 Transcript_49622/m.105617 type:complete len:273 (+) Transcript_49622:245-1063(+)
MGPVAGGDVKSVGELEAVREASRQVFQKVAAEDVRLGLVGQDERELRLVLRVAHSSLHNLQHRGQTSATSHHAHSLDRNRLAGQLKDAFSKVLVDSQRSHDLQRVSNLKSVQVKTHLASVLPVNFLSVRHRELARSVDLDHEVNIARGLVASNRSVLTIDLNLALVGVVAAVPLACAKALTRVRAVQHDVLADREAQNCVFRAQGESKALRVGRKFGDVDDFGLLSLAIHEENLSRPGPVPKQGCDSDGESGQGEPHSQRVRGVHLATTLGL